MTISDFLNLDTVLPALPSAPKDAVIDVLARAFASQDPTLSEEEVAEALRRRENIASTALRDGVAVPHARMSNLSRAVVVFARCTAGVDFVSVDGKKTHLLFAVITPANSNDHLKILSRAARLLSDDTLRTRLMQAGDADAIYALLCDHDRAVGGTNGRPAAAVAAAAFGARGA